MLPLVDSGTLHFPPVSIDLDGDWTRILSLTSASRCWSTAESEEVSARRKVPHAQLRRLPGLTSARDRKTWRSRSDRGGAANRRASACRANLSSKRCCVGSIASARRDDVQVTLKRVLHYLPRPWLDRGESATAGRCFKCSPPIREAANRELLWGGLKMASWTRCLRSSPCTVGDEERGHRRFWPPWGGITSLQLGLSVVWTEARRRGVSLGEVAGWMSTKPAQLAGLPHKGRIAVGFDADFCIFRPDQPFVVDPAKLYHETR